MRSVKIASNDDFISIRVMKGYLENRLPGADANPIVAMAVTISALVQAVREHTHKNAEEKIIVAPYTYQLVQKHEIPKNHHTLVETFNASARMRELLGSNLHNAIMQEYGHENSVSR